MSILSFFFILQSVMGSILKLSMGNSEDLAHNLLHFISGLIGLLTCLSPQRNIYTKTFAKYFGFFYFSLGLIGWFWSNPFGFLPLGVVDHIFHLAIGAISFTVGIFPTKQMKLRDKEDVKDVG